jgi:hypothetical protein
MIENFCEQKLDGVWSNFCLTTDFNYFLERVVKQDEQDFTKFWAS